MKIYLAHQMTGLNGLEVLSYYRTTKRALVNAGYEVLSPITGKEELLSDDHVLVSTGYKSNVVNNHSIFERDQWMIKMSDVVLVDLTDTTKVSIGMTMELAWASILRKHTVVIFPRGNIHYHAFVVEAADIIFDNFNEALSYLINLGAKP